MGIRKNPSECVMKISVRKDILSEWILGFYFNVGFLSSYKPVLDWLRVQEFKGGKIFGIFNIRNIIKFSQHIEPL